MASPGSCLQIRILGTPMDPTESESLGVRSRHQYKSPGGQTQAPGHNKRMVSYSNSSHLSKWAYAVHSLFSNLTTAEGKLLKIEF